MKYTVAKAKTLNLAGNIQSIWLASDDLVSQGWDLMNMGIFTYHDMNIDLPVYGSKLDAFFSSMGISFNDNSAQYMMSVRTGAYLEDDDIKYCVASEGIFGNMIDISSGITNTATNEFVIQALQKKGAVTEIPTWKANSQLTLTRAYDGDFFAAILGSPNGAGCAYLLAQHKAQLGIKQLTSVSIWMSGDTPFMLTSPIGTLAGNLNLLFTVETVYPYNPYYSVLGCIPVPL